MAFTSIEQLKEAVAERRKAILTLEVDMGGAYSQEYEDAKTELATAKALKAVTGGVGFLADNLSELEANVASTKPDSEVVWIQYKKLDLEKWASLTKQVSLSAIEQYEKVLPETFVGVYGEDPDPDERPEGWEAPEPLSTDANLVSFKSGQGILPGGALHSVVQNFMAWQNSGGDVTIRPTKSGRV